MTTAVACVALIVSFGFLYRHVAVKLVSDWWNDANYSHGFLIVPIALYFVWERRHRLVTTVSRPSVLGLLIIVASFAVLLTGVLGAELFLTRISMLGTIMGVVLFMAGWHPLKILAFPIAFLLLMIPIPAIIFYQIALPLQFIASGFGEWTLSALNIPVLREGNVIVLAHTTLEVAEACSGIRSLISLLTLGIIYGYFSDPRPLMRVAIAVLTIPVAILANGVRVAGTGIAAHYYGPEAAKGFFHTFEGWFVFLVAFVLLFVIHRLIVWFVPNRTEREPAGARVPS